MPSWHDGSFSVVKQFVSDMIEAVALGTMLLGIAMWLAAAVPGVPTV